MSYRNFMWPWFLGLVYESVTSEMSRNENKWLLLASRSLVCVEMSWVVILMHSFRLWPRLGYFLGASNWRVWFLKELQSNNLYVVMYELRNPSASGRHQPCRPERLWRLHPTFLISTQTGWPWSSFTNCYKKLQQKKLWLYVEQKSECFSCFLVDSAWNFSKIWEIIAFGALEKGISGLACPPFGQCRLWSPVPGQLLASSPMIQPSFHIITRYEIVDLRVFNVLCALKLCNEPVLTDCRAWCSVMMTDIDRYQRHQCFRAVWEAEIWWWEPSCWRCVHHIHLLVSHQGGSLVVWDCESSVDLMHCCWLRDKSHFCIFWNHAPSLAVPSAIDGALGILMWWWAASP